MLEGPRAGEGHSRAPGQGLAGAGGGALSLVRAGEEPGLSASLEGRPLRTAVPWAPGHIPGT